MPILAVFYFNNEFILPKDKNGFNGQNKRFWSIKNNIIKKWR